MTHEMVTRKNPLNEGEKTAGGNESTNPLDNERDYKYKSLCQLTSSLELA